MRLDALPRLGDYRIRRLLDGLDEPSHADIEGLLAEVADLLPLRDTETGRQLARVESAEQAAALYKRKFRLARQQIESAQAKLKALLAFIEEFGVRDVGEHLRTILDELT